MDISEMSLDHVQRQALALAMFKFGFDYQLLGI